MTVRDDLIAASDRLASAERLLVASDFDGTISPIVPVPGQARMIESARRALADLAACPRTFVAVVSGRDLATLRMVCPPIPGVEMFGSYGAERSGHDRPATPEETADLDELASRLSAIADPIAGAFVERKSLSVSINVRLVSRQEAASAALDRAHAASANLPGLTRHLGRGVVEWGVRPTRKGDVLDILRLEKDATMTVALGDDEPDMEAFDRLDHADVRILVSGSAGPGIIPVASPHEAADWLEGLAQTRRRWVANNAVYP